jgi:hypothetical protein
LQTVEGTGILESSSSEIIAYTVGERGQLRLWEVYSGKELNEEPITITQHGIVDAV